MLQGVVLLVALLAASLAGAFAQQIPVTPAADADHDAALRKGSAVKDLTLGVDYELVKTEIPNAHTPFGTFDSTEFAKHYEFSLHFDGQKEPIFLARRYEGDEPATKQDDIGFDEETLNLNWLDPQRLLHVTWKTINQGTGHYTVQSHLILLKERGVWVGLYRDSQTSAERAGWKSARYCDYGYSYEPGSSVLGIYAVESAHTTISASDPFSPYAEKIDQVDGSIVHMRSYVKRTEWRYRLKGTRLEYLGGSQGYDFEDNEKTLEAVAALLTALEHLKPDEALDRIRRLNPAFASQGKATGFVTTADSVPAHVADEAVYYCADR